MCYQRKGTPRGARIAGDASEVVKQIARRLVGS
jgi:hypothetical protein